MTVGHRQEQAVHTLCSGAAKAARVHGVVCDACRSKAVVAQHYNVHEYHTEAGGMCCVQPPACPCQCKVFGNPQQGLEVCTTHQHLFATKTHRVFYILSRMTMKKRQL